MVYVYDRLIDLFIGKQDIGLFRNYIIIAAFATILDIVIFYSLTEFVHVWYLYSAFVSYPIGMIIHYSLNKYLNFNNKSKKIIQQFGLFVIVASIGLGINQLVLFSLVEFAKLWYMFAKILAIAIAAIWNYNGHKKITFNILK